jgi:pimeloyl-ACP methyl ester carboxylesterase
MLFLHGVGGGAWSWRPQRAAFAVDHRVFVWEARGHGDAQPVDDAGLSDYYVDANEALATVAELTHQPAIVVAHSMGGLLAVALACDRPADVRGLFLIDPVYATGDGDAYGHFGPTAGRLALFLCSPLLRSIAHDGSMSRFISRQMFARVFDDRGRMEAAWTDQRRQIPVEYPRMLREAFGTPSGFTLRDFASEITQPTVVCECAAGGKGGRFPELVDALDARLGPAFAHEIIAGRHYLQLDNFEAVNERLRAFSASLATGAGNAQGVTSDAAAAETTAPQAQG